MRSDIASLKSALNDQAKAVCSYLYPGGKIEGQEYVFDPGQGKIKVVVAGSKAGVWAHFGSDDAGDLIDLWRKAKGCSLVDALDGVRDYLGVQRPKFHRDRETKVYQRPARPQGMRHVEGAVQAYLCGDRRLSEAAVEAYKIGAQGRNIIFPFLRDGELVLAKAREAIDGAKPKPTAAGCEKILFGWQAIDPDAREAYIVEGEIDAMSMFDFGYPALSVPFGGGGGNKQDWIANEFDRLDRFETIYLCLDNDPEGQAAVQEIAQRLGRHRCRVVQLPRKDANQCLIDDVSLEEIAAAVAAAGSMDPEMLRRPSEYRDNVVKLFYPGDDEPGYSLPYAAGANLRFRPSEVSVWQGSSGSGKSQMLSDCIVDWIDQGSRVCLASLEMAPAQTLKRMVKQAGNLTGGLPTEALIDASMDLFDRGLWLVDRVGKLSIDDLLDVFQYAHDRYGCDQFVIDSLMRLGLEADDYSGQEKVMFRLVDWAIDTDIHLHLVAHSRKSAAGMGAMPGIEDVKGASEIGNNAFNIIAVWRNRKLEDLIADEDTDEEERARLMATPGVVLHVSKQRNGDWEGKIGLHFNIENYQYRDSLGSRFGRHYINNEDLEYAAV